MRLFSKRKPDYTRFVMELEPGKLYVIFVEESADAVKIQEALSTVFNNMTNPPKVVIIPIKGFSPRMLYFE